MDEKPPQKDAPKKYRDGIIIPPEEILALVGACILIVRGRIKRPSDAERGGRSLEAWLRESSGVPEDEIEWAMTEAKAMEPAERGKIVGQALPEYAGKTA
ncbi:hypothetical protein [Roseiterribacter gracilis]|uniref:Uncharacterized protein n=1 Tax=Roseiterribacter gracilis TaxID=2812848 RepID=A0A8S8XA65_9PROT|nr:hypothetical protein TMPK1_31350 [Rhodospirillales bacterium TMPK1]